MFGSVLFPTLRSCCWLDLWFSSYAQLAGDELLPIAFEITFCFAGTLPAPVQGDDRVSTFLRVRSIEKNHALFDLLFPAIRRLERSNIKGFRSLS